MTNEVSILFHSVPFRSFGVTGAGRPARIIEKPDDLIRVANGGDLLLTCRVTGEPRPKGMEGRPRVKRGLKRMGLFTLL